MANPTSNFGWQMPTPTDLVTDLPADFEVFGQAVDSSLADLKGGTTGQVLSKNSNTDMDFIWVAQDDSNAIQNAIVDAKGDLIAASAADTPARLAVGANGETLVADSSATTGLRYSATPSASNPILNAACEIAQRGTTAVASTGATTQFMTDRWQVFRAVAGGTFSRQNTNDTTNLPNIRYCIRAARDSGNTATNSNFVYQNVETANTIPFAGKTVTISYYARAGANYSGTSNLLNVRLSTGTGTDQNYILGYTGSANPINTQVTLTTTWQRFTATATLGATVTEMAFVAFADPTGTAGAADFFEITGCQIDIGAVALPFRTNSGTIQGELAACQRYYYRQSCDASATQKLFGYGYATAASTGQAVVKSAVTMRTNPTSVDYTSLYLNDNLGSFNTMTTISMVAAGTGQDNFMINLSGGGGGLTTKAWYWITGISSTSFIGFSAEL
jgi:hypothetical protein